MMLFVICHFFDLNLNLTIRVISESLDIISSMLCSWVFGVYVVCHTTGHPVFSYSRGSVVIAITQVMARARARLGKEHYS